MQTDEIKQRLEKAKKDFKFILEDGDFEHDFWVVETYHNNPQCIAEAAGERMHNYNYETQFPLIVEIENMGRFEVDRQAVPEFTAKEII